MGFANSYPDWIPFFPNFLSKKDSLFFWAMQEIEDLEYLLWYW